MKKKTKKLIKKIALAISIILFLGLFFVAELFSQYLSVAYHESAHQQIYMHYGINSTIDLGGGLLAVDGTTYPEQACPNYQCTLANNLNDVIGYHFFALIFNLWVMLLITFVFIVLIQIFKKKK